MFPWSDASGGHSVVLGMNVWRASASVTERRDAVCLSSSRTWKTSVSYINETAAASICQLSAAGWPSSRSTTCWWPSITWPWPTGGHVLSVAGFQPKLRTLIQLPSPTRALLSSHCHLEITSLCWRLEAQRGAGSVCAAKTGGLQHGVLPGGCPAARTGASCLLASARETEGQGQQTDWETSGRKPEPH